MPNPSYVSLGFGRNMVNVDMLSWQAQGSTTLAQDFYSFGNNTPGLDSVGNHDTTSVTFNSDNSRVELVTKRKVDTGDT